MVYAERVTSRCAPGTCRQLTALCPGCAHRTHRHLAELPELWVRLTLNVAAAKHATQPVAGTRQAPIPINPAVVDHQAAVRAALGSWAVLIASARRLTPPADAPPFTFHTTHLNWTLQQGFAAGYAHTLWLLWAGARGLNGITDAKPVHADGVPCPRCDRMALYRTAGDDGLRCESEHGGCGQWISDTHYGQWTRLVAHSAANGRPRP